MVPHKQRPSGAGGRPWLLLCLSLLWGAAFVACTKARPLQPSEGRCVSWKADVGPAFGEHCQECHSGPVAAGKYDLTSYQGALGTGTDATPDVIAGDASSRLLTTLDSAAAEDVHAGFPEVLTLARRWVVDCKAGYVESSIHRPGILDPHSSDFHGELLRSEKYDFGVCQKCHGDDFSGGTSKVSCLSCHTKGPTTCETCHGKIAESGSHGAHLGAGKLGATYACSECHKVPTDYKDPGHIFLEDGSLDPPGAEVQLSGLAAATLAGATRPGQPVYDPAAKSCTNVYCHGGAMPDSAPSVTTPVWKAPAQSSLTCGSCHGAPPNQVGSSQCSSCHSSVVNLQGEIAAPKLHINGVVELGDPAKGCAACHGQTKDGAPPPDLAGQTASSARGVGAHHAHLTGGAHLRGPVACAECHLVPTEVASAGHFSGHKAGADTVPGAEVFPARPDSATGADKLVATADGAAPHWDAAAGTCSGVYCHGGGTKLGQDLAPGLERAPAWTAPAGLTCGIACHGVPPTLGPHLPTMTRTDCATCHPRTVDPFGEIILAGTVGAETSTHMNGVVDVAP